MNSLKTPSVSSWVVYINVNICISPQGTDIQSSTGEIASYQLFEIFVYDITLTLFTGDRIVTNAGQSYIVDGVPYIINNQYLQYIRVLSRQAV